MKRTVYYYENFVVITIYQTKMKNAPSVLRREYIFNKNKTANDLLTVLRYKKTLNIVLLRFNYQP